MTDPLTLAATAIASAKNIYGLVKTAQTLEKDADKNAALIEIQKETLEIIDWLTEAKLAEHDAKQKIMQLTEQLMDKENWENTEARYQLTEISPFAYVQSLKNTNDSGEPPHYLCTACFQHKQKSILMRTSDDVQTLKCHLCGLQIQLPEIPIEAKLLLTDEQRTIIKTLVVTPKLSFDLIMETNSWGESTTKRIIGELTEMNLIRYISAPPISRRVPRIPSSKPAGNYTLTQAGLALAQKLGILTPDR